MPALNSDAVPCLRLALKLSSAAASCPTCCSVTSGHLASFHVRLRVPIHILLSSKTEGRPTGIRGRQRGGGVRARDSARGESRDIHAGESAVTYSANTCDWALCCTLWCCRIFVVCLCFCSSMLRLICLQDVLDVTKASLYNNLKRSLSRYVEMSRPEWLMHKNPTSGKDPFVSR